MTINELSDAEWTRIEKMRDDFIDAWRNPGDPAKWMDRVGKAAFQVLNDAFPDFDEYERPLWWVDGALSVLAASVLLAGAENYAADLAKTTGLNIDPGETDDLDDIDRRILIANWLCTAIGEATPTGGTYARLSGEAWLKLAADIRAPLISSGRAYTSNAVLPTSVIVPTTKVFDHVIGLESKIDQAMRDEVSNTVPSWWLASLKHWLIVNTIEGIDPAPEELTNKAQAIVDACSTPGWVAFEGAAVMPRPWKLLKVDPEGRLDATDGPAWEWADGSQVWAIEGVRVPSWVVTDRDIKRVMGLENEEQRRVGIELIGWENAVDELGLKLLDDSGDVTIGKLYEIPAGMVSDEAMTLILCRNSSPDRGSGIYRMYGLYATDSAKTAREAQADRFGVSVEEYDALSVQT